MSTVSTKMLKVITSFMNKRKKTTTAYPTTTKYCTAR